FFVARIESVNSRLLIESLRFLVNNQRVKIYGFVLMPNHVHLIWRINPNHLQQDVQRDFLKYTAQQIKFDLLSYHPQVLAHFEVNLKDRQYQFWGPTLPHIGILHLDFMNTNKTISDFSRIIWRIIDSCWLVGDNTNKGVNAKFTLFLFGKAIFNVPSCFLAELQLESGCFVEVR
ncbi:MAG: hypothetical protein EAZ80_02335, partial [Runella slithyformis]